jgi:hypothetical protein
MNPNILEANHNYHEEGADEPDVILADSTLCEATASSLVKLRPSPTELILMEEEHEPVDSIEVCIH